MIEHPTHPVVTIDGPSGTGKGTTAQALASRLQWHYLDSGAVYRVLALASLQIELDADDIPGLLQLIDDIHMAFVTHHDRWRVALDGEDVTEQLRDENVGSQASKLSIHPPVRQALLDLQRSLAVAPGLVTDGRDMGTVVFPDAMVKIYLEASADIRAQRRCQQLKDAGISVNIDRIYEDMVDRDQRDRERSVSPTKPATDAVVIDTSALSREQVLERVVALVQDVLKGA